MSTPHPSLPPKPQAPQNYDCCGGGCADCELRLYVKALKEWKALERALLNVSDEVLPKSP